MRFGLRCIVWLAILYHAILSDRGGVDQGDVEPARVAAAARHEIASRVDTYCRRDPATCLGNAAHLASLVAAGRPDAAATDEPRHRRRGALASSTP